MLQIILLLLMTSCTHFVTEREAYVQAYRSGGFDAVETEVSKLIAKGGENEQVWLRLDRATERLVSGNPKGAIEDYQVALAMIDYFNESGLLENIGQTLFYDGAGPYRGDDYEQLLARVYFAFACLLDNDESNAIALLRQAEEWSQAKMEEYRHHPATAQIGVPENPLGKYVFAALLEKRGDISNAEILFQQSGIDLGRGGPATILIICHNGQAPYKYTEYCPASQASAFALEVLMGCYGPGPAISSLTGIPVPALAMRAGCLPIPTTATLDGVSVTLQPVFSIAQAATCEMHQKRPVVIARGVARLALRRGAVYAAQRQDPCFGQLLDLGILIANAATRADTRSWSLLPERLDLARFDVEAGSHTLKINQFETTICLKRGDVALIHVFNLYPGLSQILIPYNIQEHL